MFIILDSRSICHYTPKTNKIKIKIIHDITSKKKTDI